MLKLPGTNLTSVWRPFWFWVWLAADWSASFLSPARLPGHRVSKAWFSECGVVGLRSRGGCLVVWCGHLGASPIGLCGHGCLKELGLGWHCGFVCLWSEERSRVTGRVGRGSVYQGMVLYQGFLQRSCADSMGGQAWVPNRGLWALWLFSIFCQNKGSVCLDF